MNQKKLWKIEELWNQFYQPEQSSCEISIVENYINRKSQFHSRFYGVENFDFTESNNIVFSDDYGEYKGLSRCQTCFRRDKPIYLFDNHNEMLYPIVEIFNATEKTYDIVHIDAHPDDAEFQGKKIKELNLDKVQAYIAQTRISDFFDAISEAHLIENIHRVCHSNDFEFFLPPENPYILSLDIDIFGPEGDFCDLKDKVRAIALAWNRADAVCIAMSPGFIDQKFAQKIIEIFMK